MPTSTSRVTVIFPDELQGNGEITRPGVFFSWSDYECHYLAEGDSWFSMSDVLSPSFLYRFGNHVPLKQSTLIVNCSYPGDTLARMVDWTRNLNFPKLLARKNFAWKWDGILLSAGGNDIIDAALEPAGILQSCASPASYKDFIATNAMNILNDHLEIFFRYLVSVRDTSEIIENRFIPIFYHTYGYPTPRYAPASIAGPWLCKAFMQKNIPPQYWNELSDAIMNELADLLRSFVNISSNLQLVDTLKYVNLIRAASGSTGDSGDWMNEIHLNNAGKDKFAGYWASFL